MARRHSEWPGDTLETLRMAGRYSGDAQNGQETLGKRTEWPGDTRETLRMAG